MRLIVKDKDISQFYNRIIISGDDNSIARQLQFGVAVSGTDKNLPRLNILMNDEVKVYDDNGTLIYEGLVIDKSKSIKNNIMEVRAIESMIALKSIGSYSFDNTNPQEIAKKLIKESGLTPGNIVSAKPLTRQFDMERRYDIIQTAYYLDYEQTKKPYIIRQNGNKIDVVEKGKEISKYELNANSNLLDSNYSENAEETVSKVEIYDTNGKKVGEVTGKGLKGTTLVYKQEENEDAQARAKELLQQIERMATITAIGDFSLITGNAVMIKESYTGLWGKFYIVSDTHTIENKFHKVELELAFKNTMTEPSSSSDAESEELGGTSVSGDSMGAKALSVGKTVQGSHYLYGGNNPATGIDCSGFVQWTYNQNGANIPGRVTAATMRSNPKQYGFVEIPFNERQPGDVLWQKGHLALQSDGGKILESGGVSKRYLGYSGVYESSGKGRTFSKAYRYVGGGK